MAENAKIFLVGNKLDLVGQEEVTEEDIELFVEQFPKFDGIYKISCKANIGVEEMFTDITSKLSGSFIYKANSMVSDTLQLHNNQENCCEDENKESFCCAK